MDFTTILGLVIGVAVVTAAIATGSDLWIFFNLPGFLIVCGGTFAATLIKFPMSSVLIAMRVGVRAAFVNEQDNPRDLINQAIRMARIARRKGLLGLDKAKINNTFFSKGLQLCADGRDVDFIRKMLTKEMDLAIQRQEISERVFRAIGDSAPAFGMFGTLVGLIQMLSNMQDPTTIGSGNGRGAADHALRRADRPSRRTADLRQASGQDLSGAGQPPCSSSKASRRSMTG